MENSKYKALILDGGSSTLLVLLSWKQSSYQFIKLMMNELFCQEAIMQAREFSQPYEIYIVRINDCHYQGETRELLSIIFGMKMH